MKMCLHSVQPTTVLTKPLTCYISIIKLNYTKPLTASECTLKMMIMLLWKFSKILLMSAVI